MGQGSRWLFKAKRRSPQDSLHRETVPKAAAKCKPGAKQDSLAATLAECVLDMEEGSFTRRRFQTSGN